jgi:hypothetical protein
MTACNPQGGAVPVTERGPLIAIFILIVISAVALTSVGDGGWLPSGYTRSLILFAGPTLVLVPVLVRERATFRAWIEIGMAFFVLGVVLDTCFGLLFFCFDNPEATLGLNVYGYDWDARRWVLEVPVEELLFYGFGFAAILGTYAWLAQVMARRSAAPQRQIADARMRLLAPAILLGLVVITLAVKRALGGGVPGWMLYMLIVGCSPAALLIAEARRHIHWAALVQTTTLVVCVSLIWEVTLGVPNLWWGYREESMIGVFIEPWHHLPIEQPILWLVVSFACVTPFELRRAQLRAREQEARA